MPVPLNWRRFPERYLLRGSYCETCKQAFFPSRAICPNCRRKGKLISIEMPRTGRIISYTRVHVPPEGFKNEAPYYLAIIELENGAKVLSQIVDSNPEKIKIGARVKKVFRRIAEPDEYGTITYGYKFKVIE
ncbi:MAG: Zn-ribbon domain-containing OB-fold protein [Candidatus Diapherotrites archaeon]|nr:Zn-ribbon domain-containing OB-fold protein [Candidatus Diapherotrites archaeon]